MQRVLLLWPHEESGPSGSEVANTLRADSSRRREESGGDHEGGGPGQAHSPGREASMTQKLPEPTRFPCACPHCETAAGIPFRVRTDATDADCVHIELRCRHCHREWHVDRTAPALRPHDLGGAHGAR